MREIWVAIWMSLALVGAPAAVVAQTPSTGDTAGALAPTDQDRVFGRPDAPITIVEYASLTCPHCAHFAAEVLPKLREKWIDTGKVKLVLRDFPLDEPALRAAMMARCAPAQRFYPLIETLFQTQDKWATATDWRAALEHLVLLAGISKKEFDACLADKAVEDQVAQSRLTAATQLGVSATPTFFINGEKYAGAPTFEEFDKRLSALAEKS